MMEAQKDLVEIVHTLRQVANYKGPVSYSGSQQYTIKRQRTTVGVSRGPRQPVTREWSPKRVAARYSTWRWSLLLRTIIGPGGCSTSRLRR